MLTLDRIRAAMQEALYGAPTRTVELRHKGTSDAVPTALDVLVRQIDDEESWAYLGTAGMSALEPKGDVGRVELMMRVDGKRPEQDLEKLARWLGDLAVAPFRQGLVIREEMIFDDLEIPLYTGMTSAAITPWVDPAFLPGIDPPVRLLEVTPLFPREAEVVQTIGVAEALQRVVHEGINPWDPDREEARMEELPVGSNQEQYDPDLALRPVDAIWDELEPWLAANAPRIHAQLRPGVAEEKLAELEAAIGDACPLDLRAWLSRHDGAPELAGYRFLPVQGVLSTWRDMQRLVDKGAFADGRAPDDESGRVFQPVWWHRGWLPVAEDSAGNLTCLDLAPGPYGVRGQVLFWDRHTGAEASRAPSLGAWLDAFLAGCRDGRYVVDEEGFIQPA